MLVTVPNLWNYDRYGPGVITEWYKKEGDLVKKKEPLCQIMVIKATYIVESPVDGKLTRIIAQKGTRVKPGDPLAEIEEVAAPPTPTPAPIPQPAPQVIAPKVEEYSVIKIGGVRKVIADRMTESLRTAAQYTLHTDVDATELVRLRELRFRDYSYTELLSYIVIKALKEFPNLNAHVVNDEIRVFNHVHLGIGIQTDQGLFVGVVKNADTMDLDTLTKNIRKVVDDVRQGKATPEELTGSTFTISNLGMTEVTYFTPIINPPEVAILGIGKIRDINGKKLLPLSLTLDHRVIDGYVGAQFLGKLKELIEKPHEVLPGLPPPPEVSFSVTAVSISDTKIEASIRNFKVIVDEPEEAGGTNTAPNPIEYLLLALAGCMNVTIRKIAKERGIKIDTMQLTITGSLNPARFGGIVKTGRAGLTRIRIELSISTTAPKDVINSIIKEAEERCPVHDTLAQGTQIEIITK
ncbi:CatA-like O-acetyltransferase [Vulcanisaeta thermophila]|uniref:CatA-like O-acetyltransferase n=1 Tax=Vulcanisaeta thermophila TaxID=867917 RepID=UPI000852A1DA|nr:CatA-like O-acetyltransferase [Vulcanisaeta thermophila]